METSMHIKKTDTQKPVPRVLPRHGHMTSQKGHVEQQQGKGIVRRAVVQLFRRTTRVSFHELKVGIK